MLGRFVCSADDNVSLRIQPCILRCTVCFNPLDLNGTLNVFHAFIKGQQVIMDSPSNTPVGR